MDKESDWMVFMRRKWTFTNAMGTLNREGNRQKMD
jgi:hypothetical protein